MGKAPVLVGTAGWHDHAGFYPRGVKPDARLTYYASRFPLVEVNATAYGVPAPKTVAAWIARTPPAFVFDVKPPRQLTGTPDYPGGVPPPPDAELVTAFAEAVAPLVAAGRLGALTFQFPPSWHNTAPNRDYLARLPGLLPCVHLAVEFRHRSWLDDEHQDATLALLREHGLAYIMADEPQIGSGTVPPVYGVTTPALALIRLHGRNTQHWYTASSTRDRYDHEYSADELGEWLPKIARARGEAATVHVIFNTCGGGQGPRNAGRLLALLGQASAAPVQAALNLTPGLATG